MNEKETQVQATDTIQMARIVAVAAIVGLPFAVRSGLAPLPYLLSAAAVGAVWLSALLLSWRRRNEWLSGVGFLIVIFGHKFAQSMLPSEPYAFFFQWLITMILTSFGILALRRSAVLHLCQLKDAENA